MLAALKSPGYQDWNFVPRVPSSTGDIEFHDTWNAVARDAGCNWDRRDLSDEFRKFCRYRNIPLDTPKIARRFHTFCKKLPRR